MDVIKPQPLMMGGKAYYTLASTDPVQIEVTVPQVTDKEVDLALAGIVEQTGGDPKATPDSAWLQANFGTPHLEDVREGLRAQMTDANYNLLQQQREQACAAELAKRLNQSVPETHVAEVRQQLESNFMAQLRSGGTTLDEVLEQMGASRLSISETFDAQAKVIAEQDAALGAFARERKLDVAEEDYPRLLRMPASQVLALIEQARAVGQLEGMRESVLRNRALEVVVAECVCTYRHETDEEALARVHRMNIMQGGAPAAPSGAGDRPAPPVNPNLKLV